MKITKIRLMVIEKTGIYIPYTSFLNVIRGNDAHQKKLKK